MAWSSRSDFYNSVYDKAISLGANDVQARLAAAQASQETGYGQHFVGNNLFGIKAGSDYAGDVVNAGTNEEYNGQNVRENANFRAYNDPLDSVAGYLSVIQSNFPDAWNAPTFSEAVQGLKTGVFGSYATDSKYGSKIAAIDKNMGGVAFAQNPDNVPAPYGPNDPVPDFAVPDDVMPTSDANFVPMSGEFAFATRPTNVPVPEARPEDIAPSVLTGYQPIDQTQTPFDAVMPGQWGLNKNVAPALIPTVETWSDMAAATPVAAPMGGVQAQGFLGTSPDLSASTTAGLLSTPSERMGLAEPGFDMNRLDGASPSVASNFDPGRFGPEVAFDTSRLGPLIDPVTNTTSFASPQPVDVSASGLLGGVPGFSADAAVGTAPGFDASRFASNPTTSRIGTTQTLNDTARMNPLTGAINPATNTASFMDQPADIGGFLDAMAAQRGPTTGINSAEHQTQVANAMRGMLNPTVQAPAPETVTGGFLTDPAFAATNFNAAMNPSVPSMNVPAAVPSLASAYTPTQIAAPVEQTVDPTTTGSTTPGLFSPTSITTSTPALTGGGSLTGGLNRGLLADQPINQVGFLSDLSPNIDINLSGNIVPATPAEVAAPAVETVDVADQPTINATVEGPATTPAIEQQQQVTAPASATTTTPTTQTATTAKSKGILSGLMSPEALGGGLLGGLALGPAGGLIGALAGQQIARNGGLASMLSGQPATINNIGGGLMNTASIWGGSTEPGTQATTSNGGTVTQMPSGLVAVTGPSGVTTGFDSTGKGYSMWGGTPGKDGETTSTNSGGFFGGLFG